MRTLCATVLAACVVAALSPALKAEDELSILSDAMDFAMHDATFTMYHEIGQPYEFLWRMRPSLKPGGEVVVVDADRATQNHGTPPALLKCEFAAVGYTQVTMQRMPSAGGYIAVFRADGPRPDPAAIRACRLNPSPAATRPGA